jgi:hypothetical protein
MKDSGIWRDAKDLLVSTNSNMNLPSYFTRSYSPLSVRFFQKIVNKTYNKRFPTDEDGENAEGDGGKGKIKGPNLTRLVKSRLQKLVDKTDET